MSRASGARPGPALAVLAAVAVLATLGAPSPAAAGTGDGPRRADERGELAIDAGAARANPADPSLLPGGLAGRFAKRVESIRSDGGSGFLPFHQRAHAYGAYRFQLVASGSDGDAELLRPGLERLAAELTEITRITFTVDPGQVLRPSSVRRFPTGWCGGFDGHQCSFFDDADESVGVIRVGFAGGSPCRQLAPRGQGSGTIGCAGPESARAANGDVHHLRGNVWVSPSVNDVNRPIAHLVVAHEVAHAFGLDHYDRRFTSVPGGDPVRQLMYPSVHHDPTDRPGGSYRTGDVNGLWWLQGPEAWYIAATYRDFLGRVPDNAGYRFWVESDATPRAYVDSLATSDEWVGRIVGRFYRDVFGRAPDPGGFAYWSSVLRSQGVPAVAAQLYGSAEYLRAQGGTVAGLVAGLYRQLLGRDAAADPQGHAYWVAEAQRRGTVAVAGDFYQSVEKRRDRVRELYCTLLERPPDPAGQAYWADVILVEGDLALARNLATSPEYVARADDLALLPLDAPPAC